METIGLVLLPGLVLGFLGSFHCVGMCGPIALSLPVAHLSGIRKVAGILFYNLGRVITYTLLGLVFGLIGQTLSFFGTQQILSITLGALLLVGFFVVILQRSGRKKQYKWQLWWNQFITKRMLPFFKKKGAHFMVVLGFFNGLLPCGLVYMAVAGAVAFASLFESALFMASFGLGTLPAMAALSFAGSMVSLNLRNKIRKLSPFVMGVMGLLLVLRGLNLNVPYISPALSNAEVECCAKPHE